MIRKNCIAFSEYLLLYKYSKNTVKNYVQSVEQFLMFTGLRSDEAPTLEQVESFVFEIVSDFTPQTANNKIAALRSYYNWAYSHNLINGSYSPSKIFSLMPRLRKQTKEKTFLRWEEYAHVYMFLPMQTDEERLIKFLLCFFLGTGARCEEVATMKKEDFTPDYIRIYGKGQRMRLIPNCMYEIFCEEYFAKMNAVSEYLFFDLKTFAPLRPHDIRNLLYSALLPTFKERELCVPHALRHAFAVYLQEQGEPLNVIADILGHSSIETTRNYLNYKQLKNSLLCYK